MLVHFRLPLAVQRLSIFSILAPERVKKLSIGVHGFAETEKIDSLCPGRGQARPARAGEDSSRRCCVTTVSSTMTKRAGGGCGRGRGDSGATRKGWKSNTEHENSRTHSRTQSR